MKITNYEVKTQQVLYHIVKHKAIQKSKTIN